MRWHVGVVIVRVSTLPPQFMCCDLSLSPSWPAVVATWLVCPLYSISAHNLFLPSAITCQHHTHTMKWRRAGHREGGAHILHQDFSRAMKIKKNKSRYLKGFWITNISRCFLGKSSISMSRIQDLMLVVLMMLCEHIIVTFSRFLWWQTLTLMAWVQLTHWALVTRQSPAT